jgi:hypothetical protein
MKTALVTLLLLLVTATTRAQVRDTGEQLLYHTIKTDAQGVIVPWYSPHAGESYDFVIRQVWQFWRNMRTCPNGVKYYLQHQVWKENEDDPRALGGDQLAMALSSWNLLHGYLGDKAVLDDMIYIADYYLAHSLAPATDRWAHLPYPYNLDVHSGKFTGDMRAGPKFTQPDKAASFAAELITLYKITNQRKYLDAAVRIANTLARNIEPGDAQHSPWPYRVHSATNEVHQSTAPARNKVSEKGQTRIASYTTNFAPALLMFDQLIELKQGDVAAYKRAHKLLADWLKAWPLKNNKWGPFFEDIPTHDYSDTAINAGTLASYILEKQTAWDANWKQQVEGIMNWVDKTFGNQEWAKYGVMPINEQTAYQTPGNSHSSRHSAIELLFCETTGDCARKVGAIRRLHWATYMVDRDGKNRYPRDDIWLTDGYGDYVRHYLRAMAAAPELAPDTQNHLLRSSSVIQNISYGNNEIRYAKFDAQSVERFKLGAWTPKSVKGGKLNWNAATKVLEIQANAKTVTIRR